MSAAGGGELERARRLMMAALDDELTEAERAELERMLADDAELEAEWERLRRLKEVTDRMKLQEPPPEVWEGYWTSVYRRLERGIAWILVSVGAIVLISYAAWQGVREMLADAETPLAIKGAILALIVGGVALLVSVLREKLFTRRHDPYKDVQR